MGLCVFGGLVGSRLMVLGESTTTSVLLKVSKSNLLQCILIITRSSPLPSSEMLPNAPKLAWLVVNVDAIDDHDDDRPGKILNQIVGRHLRALFGDSLVPKQTRS